MSAKADFHNHSTASDGKLRPAQLVDLAAANGVRIFAMTDHDSTEGIVEAKAAAEKHSDLILVPGVELSTDIEGTEVHVLGYLSEEALRIMRHAIAKAPDLPTLNYHLGAALYQSGRNVEAKVYLAKALKSTEPFQGRREAQQLLARTSG